MALDHVDEHEDGHHEESEEHMRTRLLNALNQDAFRKTFWQNFKNEVTVLGCVSFTVFLMN